MTAPGIQTVFVRVAMTVIVVVAVMGNFRSSIKRACSLERPQAKDPHDLASTGERTDATSKRQSGIDESMTLDVAIERMCCYSWDKASSRPKSICETASV